MRKLHRYLPVLLALALAGFAGSGCTKEVRKNRHLARGNSDFQAQKYDQAEIEYKKVLQVAPANSEAIRQLGLLYAEQGKLVDAYRYLVKAAELDPANQTVHLKLGVTFLALGDYKKALEEAYLVLAKQPGQSEALEVVLDSSVYGGPKAIDEAQQRINQMRQSDQDRAGYHVAAGTFYLRRQDGTNAEIEFKKALELDPKSAAALVALGGLHWARNDLEAADKALKSASDFSPIRSYRRVKYAEFKVRTGKPDEGRKLVEEITRQAPDYLPAWNFLAELALSDKKYDDCNGFLQRVLARDPSNYDAGMLNGNLYLARGDATNAVSAFNRLTTVYHYPQLQLQLARAQLRAGDSAKALITLKQAVADYPNFADAILQIASLNIGKGDFPAAIAALTDLTRKQPQIPQAHMLLINAYVAQKNLDQAFAVAQRMLQIFPNSPDVMSLIGTLQVQQKKLVEARQSFEKALALSTNNLTVIEKLVSLDILEQKYPAALDRLQKLVEQFPKAPAPLILIARVHMAAAQSIADSEQRKNGGASAASASLANVAAAQPDVNQAEAALLKAIDLVPGFRTPYMMLGQLYAACGRQQQALDRLNGLLSKTNDVAVLLQVAMLQETLNNHAAARDAYEKILATEPNYPAALNNLACLYSDQFKDLNKAYQLIEKARRLDHDDPSIADSMGWILYQRGEYPRALVLLEESATKLSDHPDIQFHIGLVHYALCNEAPARNALEQAAQAKDFKDKDEADRRLAILAIDPNNPDPATRPLLEKRLQEAPTDPIALVRLGAIQERQGATDKAIESYLGALRGNEKNSQTMLKLAQLYSSSSSADGAQKAFTMAKNAHELAPDDVRISALLGRLAYQTGDAKWASSLLEDSARKIPNDPAISYDLAWAYYTLGRVADAQNTMQTAAQASGFAKAEDARRFLAAVAAAGDPARANQMTAEVQKMLSSNPSYLPGLMLSALIQEGQGDFKQAAQIYEQILDRYKYFTPATRNLGLLYFAPLHEDQKAYDLLSKASQSFPQDSDVAKALGILNYRKGNYPGAVKLLKQSAASRKADAELFYYLGMAQYQLKSKIESKASLQEAVSLNLQAKLEEDAKRVLAELK